LAGAGRGVFVSGVWWWWVGASAREFIVIVTVGWSTNESTTPPWLCQPHMEGKLM
jgi:hypothetical protein